MNGFIRNPQAMDLPIQKGRWALEDTLTLWSFMLKYTIHTHDCEFKTYGSLDEDSRNCMFNIEPLAGVSFFSKFGYLILCGQVYTW